MAASRLAPRIADISLSPTMRVAMEADRMRRSGVALLDLGAGEPDFPTPPHVAAAARAAIDEGFTKYTANPGTAELREAVAATYRASYGVAYAADQVIITAGAKQALHHAALALFAPGDEVITHAPGWPTLTEQIRLAGATAVHVRTDESNGFRLTADLLLSAVTPSTRGMIINSPTNPTGALLSEEDAAIVGREAARRRFWILLDLCYEHLIYGDGADHHNLPAAFGRDAADWLVVCGSASKTYAMTGWRCGWMLAPREVVQAANALQSHQTSNVSSIAQKAAVAALTGPQTCVAEMRRVYEDRRGHVIGWLRAEPRISCAEPRGAFYLFPNVGALLSGRCPDTLQFADRLLHERHVVVTPGEGFYAPGYVRLSFAASLDVLREGVTRMLAFARALAP